MRKIIYYLFFVSVYFFPAASPAQGSELANFAASIITDDLQRHLKILAADEMQGRQTGTDAALKAADYIAGCFERYRLIKPFDDSYFQAFLTSTPGVNVIGIIEGSDLKNQAIVISAHYDHVGVYNDSVYNGANDNASGVAALLELAEAFSAIVHNNHRPRHSIVFIAFDAKEKNMAGSAYYVSHPLFAMQHTLVNLNIDAVGRVDGSPNGQPNYLFLVGADRVTSELRKITDYINTSCKLNLTLDYSFYNSETFSEIFYLFSDQYNFGKHNVPVVYYTDGINDDAYKPSDTEDLINYPILRERTQLIFYTAWMLANRGIPLKKDLLRKSAGKNKQKNNH